METKATYYRDIIFPSSPHYPSEVEITKYMITINLTVGGLVKSPIGCKKV